VRIFQIYGALAMTVLDTDIGRKASVQMKGYQRSDLYGGTKGGGLAKTGTTAGPFYTDVSKTPFIPLATIGTASEFFKGDSANKLLTMVDKSEGEFILKWERKGTLRNVAIEMSIPGYYRKGGERREVEVTMRYINETTIVMSINGTVIQEFVKDIGEWVFRYDDKVTKNPKQFYDMIHAYFEDSGSTGSTGSTGYTGSSSYTGSIGSTGSTGFTGLKTTGKSSYESFDTLKKIYEDRLGGKAFPKAYCIGRALILTNRILQPGVSQLCRAKYDFETVEYMPKAGKQPRANIYFQSLVALYYDKYELNGSTVTFKQSQPAVLDLQHASKQLGDLHRVTTPNFLESSSPFPQFIFCPKGTDMFLDMSPQLRNMLMKDVITPMLRFQEEHTLMVNSILNEMFIIQATGISLSPRLKMGRAAVNAYAEKARNLLLDYYKVSEMYFVKGVLLFEKNPSMWRAV
jgi:hypothetical protein